MPTFDVATALAGNGGLGATVASPEVCGAGRGCEWRRGDDAVRVGGDLRLVEPADRDFPADG